MKNLLLLTVIFLLGCSSDDNNPDPCINRLWGLTENCTPDGSSCAYIATYGETAESAGSINTNQSTYEHYSALGDTGNGSICWDGTKE